MAKKRRTGKRKRIVIRHGTRAEIRHAAMKQPTKWGAKRTKILVSPNGGTVVIRHAKGYTDYVYNRRGKPYIEDPDKRIPASVRRRALKLFKALVKYSDGVGH